MAVASQSGSCQNGRWRPQTAKMAAASKSCAKLSAKLANANTMPKENIFFA
jgi:hypothetical protein